MAQKQPTVLCWWTPPAAAAIMEMTEEVADLKVEIKLEPGCTQPHAVLYTDEITEEIREMAERLAQAPAVLLGYREGLAAPLIPADIIRIFAQSQKVLAQTAQGIYTLRLRLYEAEEQLGSRFVRISGSELVNFKRVRNLDFSYSGSIGIVFENGERSFVSRRYVGRIKQYLGMRGEG